MYKSKDRKKLIRKITLKKKQQEIDDVFQVQLQLFIIWKNLKKALDKIWKNGLKLKFF